LSFENITLQKVSTIATITLNRPDRLNALNENLLAELAVALDDVSADPLVHVLILTGSGKAFCAGGDFRYSDVKSGKTALEEAEDMRNLYSDIKTGRLPPETSSIFINLMKMEKPTIAMINGDAIGGGLDLALCCDMRIGAASARFSVGFTRIGLTPDSGGAWLLPRIVGLGKALEMIFTADFFSAEECFRIGLLNRLVALDNLENETMTLARKLADGPPIALRLSKIQAYQGLEMNFETSLTVAAAYLNITSSSMDHLEGIKAFIEKRKPIYKGI